RRPAPITRLVPARPGWRGPAPARLLGALAVALVALASAWAIWQPQRSDLSAGDALAQASTGRLAAARLSALRAHDRNPLAAEPLFDLALVQDSQGQPRA